MTARKILAATIAAAFLGSGLLAVDLGNRTYDTAPTSVAVVTTTSATPATVLEQQPATTRAPVAKTKHVTGTYTPAYALQTVALIRDGFSRFGAVVAEQAVRVAGCETGWLYDPRATNGDHDGLFQLSERYHRARALRLGFTWAQMLEPIPNIIVAADLYAEQGWNPWTCQP